MYLINNNLLLPSTKTLLIIKLYLINKKVMQKIVENYEERI